MKKNSDHKSQEIHISKLLRADSRASGPLTVLKEALVKLAWLLFTPKAFGRLYVKSQIERHIDNFSKPEKQPKFKYFDKIYYLWQPRSSRFQLRLWTSLHEKVCIGQGKRCAKVHGPIIFNHEENWKLIQWVSFRNLSLENEWTLNTIKQLAWYIKWLVTPYKYGESFLKSKTFLNVDSTNFIELYSFMWYSNIIFITPVFRQ